MVFVAMLVFTPSSLEDIGRALLHCPNIIEHVGTIGETHAEGGGVDSFDIMLHMGGF